MALSTFSFTKTISYCKSNNICSHITIILHREPVGGRNCFLGHGVTYRVAEQATASARLQLRKRVWSLTLGSCLPAGAKVFGFTQICVKVNCSKCCS